MYNFRSVVARLTSTIFWVVINTAAAALYIVCHYGLFQLGLARQYRLAASTYCSQSAVGLLLLEPCYEVLQFFVVHNPPPILFAIKNSAI